MSGVHRFLSRRDKNKPSTVSKKEGRSDHFNGVFTLDEPTKKKPDKEEERKIKGIVARIESYGIDNLDEANVEYALRTAVPQGDPEAAFKLLMLLEETFEGIVRPFDPDKKLLGAVNRESVTCYLDALLFAMFARLDSFEAMLYNSFEDPERKSLAGLLRLWVNLLRSGRLIPVDVTKRLQEAMSACGWEDAAKLKQQDPSEAFGFITGQLELPLLTLKMDLYHTGREDPQDDHKFVNERLLEVAIPDKPSESNAVITLEDCLEHYFNNRIEVKRHMQEQRRNTLKQFEVEEKSQAGLHVEIAELTNLTDTPLSTPISETPTSVRTLADRIRPSIRGRADSIFSQRKVELEGVDPEKVTSPAQSDVKSRKMSTRTEVLMPAWQFFKLLPWYTDHMPTSDAQVAAHFSKKRPVLGICLKRYSYTNTGKAQRTDTYIDIPLEIAVPNFVSDDNMDEGPLMGNFRLLLQSVVCHRGASVHSGHYICLSRGRASNAGHAPHTDSDSDSDIDDPWMRFDDLATERVSYVDIHQALKDETPYLLFYQVQPVDEDGRSIHDLPSYAEATSHSMPDPILSEKSDTELNSALASPAPIAETEATDFAISSRRTSLDQISPSAEAPRGRSSLSVLRDERRGSVSFDDTSLAGSTATSTALTDAASSSVPATPSEEKPSSFLSVMGSRRGSKPHKSKSRPASNGPDAGSGRFSLNMAKLTAKMSRVEAPVAESELPPALAAMPDRVSVEKSPHVISAVVLATDGKETIPKALPEKGRKGKSSRKEKKEGQDDRECTLM
ncbi:hypothetical protein AMS68_003855 [Peltaster fructicola]|uniref:ubiquitinyl hydrolase 1 n=1 Tax=Peltaster fructicola TaxID=286661 RepID=A0A6H0XUQ0_9PEZI|nr:hypothetical protein AMS68_003855 [Peltaster fructicola]